MDVPDEKLESQLDLTQKTLRNIMRVMSLLEPIAHDLKDGTLKRVAKSRYVPPSTRSVLSDTD